MWALSAIVVLAASAVFEVPTAPTEQIRVTISGQGDNVVLIPGLCGAAYSYRKITPLLNEAGHRTVVIEPLAIGNSSRPDNADYSLTAQAHRIAAVMDARDLGPALFVAHGVGASMVFRLAVERPDLVKGIVSIDGGPAETATGSGLRNALTFAPILKFFGGQGLLFKKTRGQLVSHSMDPSWVTDEVVDAYTEGARSDPDGTLRALQQMSRAEEPVALVPNLPRITCPVELLQSGFQHSARADAEDIQVMKNTLPSFQMYTVPGSGHYIQEENPAAVAVAVERVLRRAVQLSGTAVR